ncbi:MAG TPA: insulinase family protein [Planctomycetes bacterium]|nr:insulinase family protein [Planctomycetota bacterium]HIN81170.1 insulinase family protein [Planctomycetota bacterium]
MSKDRGNSTPRFESHQLEPGLELHLRQDVRRKTHRLQVSWVGDLDQNAAARALVPNCLLRGTTRDPSIVAVSRRSEELWGAVLTGDVLKSGEVHVIQYTLEFVDDAYLPDRSGILSDCTHFLSEVLADPHLVEGRFPEEVVQQEKQKQRRLIESLINNKRSYANFRCTQEACSGERFRLHEYGTVEELEGIDASSLTDLWRRLVASSPKHVHFSGNLETSAVLDALAPVLQGHQGDPLPLKGPTAPRSAGDPREVVEEMEVQQADLVFCFRTEVNQSSELLEPLVIANGILGVFAHSKLFLNVREKASLCYYVGSRLENSVGLLFISSGIDVAKYSLAKEKILEQVEDLKAGHFTDDDLLATQKSFDNHLRVLEDLPAALMGIDLSWRLAGRQTDPVEYRKRLLAVTRDQVIEAVSHVELDTAYLLRPAGRA